MGKREYLRYTGKQTSKAGREFKGFEVYVAGDDALQETREVPLRVATGEGG